MEKISYENSAGVVLLKYFEGERKFLLLHYHSGHWDFPKGHIEKGEKNIDAALRELEEETGIKNVKIFNGFKREISYAYVAKDEEYQKRIKEGIGTHVEKSVTYFLAQTEELEVKLSHEHMGYAWLGYEEAFKKITFENARKILKQASEWLG